MQRLARQRCRHLSAILNGLKATYTDACGLAWGKPNIHMHVRSQAGKWRQFGFSCNSSPWARMRNTYVSKWCRGNASCSVIKASVRLLFERRAHWQRGRSTITNPWTSGKDSSSLASVVFKTWYSIPSKALIGPTLETNEWEIWQLEISFFLSNRRWTFR